MTALDQAFIKAYVRHGGVPTPAMVEQARPVPLAQALTGSPAPGVPAEVRNLAVIKALEGMPSEKAVGLPGTEAVEEVARECYMQTDDAAEAQTNRTREEPEPSGCGGTCCRAPARLAGQPGPSVEDLKMPLAVCCFAPEAPTIPVAPAESGAAAGAEINAGPPGEPPEPAAATAPEAFCPLFQTDRFDWPDVCRALDAGAQPHFDRLADALEAGLPQGRKVVGLGGLRRGEGCTTLLLCAARRLASRGLKVLMVDADADDPQLDRRLGLAPEAGWQDVAAGRVALAEAVIESVEDRLAVLPFGARGADGAAPKGDAPLAAAALEILRRSYDLVLVDLGPSCAAASGQRLPAQTAAGAIDAVVLVCDVRSTSREKLAGLQDRLAEAGIAQAGLVENFVPAGETTEPRTP